MKIESTQKKELNEFTIYATAHEIYQSKKRIKLEDLIDVLKGRCIDIIIGSDKPHEALSFLLSTCEAIKKDWNIIRSYFKNETFDRADLTSIHRGIDIDEMNRHYRNRFETRPIRIQKLVVDKFNELKLLTDDILPLDFRMLVKEGGTAIIHKSRDNSRLCAFFMALSATGLVHDRWQSAICEKRLLLSPNGSPISRSNVNSTCTNIKKMKNSKYRDMRDDLIFYFTEKILGQ